MTQHQKRGVLYAVPLLLLFVPLIAMQFTAEVNWTLSDFAVAAVLLFGTAALIDLVWRKVNSKKKKLIFSILILLALMVIWAELAVGIFGSPFAGS